MFLLVLEKTTFFWDIKELYFLLGTIVQFHIHYLNCGFDSWRQMQNKYGDPYNYCFQSSFNSQNLLPIFSALIILLFHISYHHELNNVLNYDQNKLASQKGIVYFQILLEKGLLVAGLLFKDH